MDGMQWAEDADGVLRAGGETWSAAVFPKVACDSMRADALQVMWTVSAPNGAAEGFVDAQQVKDPQEAAVVAATAVLIALATD